MASSTAPLSTSSTSSENPRATETVLAAEAVFKQWRPDQAPILAGVELSIGRGRVVAITGRNGAGKTTLLRIAAGLLTPDRGSVRLLGIDPERDRTSYNRRLGFLAAGNTGLYARLNVEHHLELWSRLSLLPRAVRRESIVEVSDMFALSELRGLRVDRLSMGQRQRLRLALTFLHRPDLVLLDEPHTSLDAEAVAILDAALARLRARGGAAIVCAPELARGSFDVDAHYVIGDGRLRETPWAG